MNYLKIMIIAVIVSSVLPNTCIAQAPPILLQKCFGGDSTDSISCIRQTSDGGYIAAGRTTSVNGDLAGNGGITGLWVLKLDAMCNIEWEKTYNDTFYQANYIEPTNDGGYILTGSQTIKLNNDGSINWFNNLSGLKIHQTADNGYIMCDVGGAVSSVSKLNVDGSLSWQKTYTPNSTSEPRYYIYDVCPSFYDGYMITGLYISWLGYYSAFVSKIDDTGRVIPPDPAQFIGDGAGREIAKTLDYNYVVAGAVGKRGLVSKFDDTCRAFWSDETQKFFGYTSVASTFDSGYVACGDFSNSLFSDLAITKFDSNGIPSWQKWIGGSLTDGGSSVIQNVDGNYVVAGYTYSNDSDVSGNHGQEDGWVVILGTNVGVPQIANSGSDIKVYPVPSSDMVQITLPVGYDDATLQLKDVVGKTIEVQQYGTNLTREMHMKNIPAGIYLLEIANKGNITTRKIVRD